MFFSMFIDLFISQQNNSVETFAVIGVVNLMKIWLICFGVVPNSDITGLKLFMFVVGLSFSVAHLTCILGHFESSLLDEY